MTNALRCFLLLAALAFSACAPSGLPSAEGEHRAAVIHLKAAAAKTLTAEQRVVLYLESAREASELLDSSDSGEPARVIYNKAVTDLTVFLRSADNGSLWNRPQTLSSGESSYRLRFAKGTRDGMWDPAYFTSFTPAGDVDLKTVERRNHQVGTGGALVGAHKTNPLAAFSPKVGITAPVTAVLNFKGNDVILSLIDPTEKTKADISGKKRLVDADFTAPLSYYPGTWEFWEGLMGALKASKHMDTTGLYMLQPYDPKRIPVIFVHGLISTPRMWRNVINEIEMDPVLRQRYQCWVFSYPTGNPPLYSALRFRDELEKFRKLYPDARNCVLVGHSMGGIVSRTQVTTIDRNDWDVIGKDKAAKFFKNIKKGDLVDRCTIFNANPRVDRAIFICTPHRGSSMAIGTLGDLAIRLISLPTDLVTSVTDTIGQSMAVITGDSDRLPSSVTGLSPQNPTLKVLDVCPITVPHHSIIGDEGKGDSPNSSDGVVEYWSSHLDSAQSEKIVPGPHGSCELPETIAELKRLLHVHLKEN
jgi:pimeloyl-ACP methyl ester carboxylesterase